MAEVPNQKIIERYKELLANRSHDVIVMNLALEMLEADIQTLKDEKQQVVEAKQRVVEENETLKRALEREKTKTSPVIQGEVLE